MTDSVIPDDKTKIVLASSSPRRIELLNNLGLRFHTFPSNVDEVFEPDKKPHDTVIELARLKATSIMENIDQLLSKEDIEEAKTILVLGADTTVVLDNRLMGKPENVEVAKEMLQQLSERRHAVFTGVVIMIKDTETNQISQVSSFEMSHVFFRKLTESEISAYVNTGEPMDKAGAYALQGIGSAFVQKIEGCFTNVIGLPIPLVVSMLRRAGITVLGSAGRH